MTGDVPSRFPRRIQQVHVVLGRPYKQLSYSVTVRHARHGITGAAQSPHVGTPISIEAGGVGRPIRVSPWHEWYLAALLYGLCYTSRRKAKAVSRVSFRFSFSRPGLVRLRIEWHVPPVLRLDGSDGKSRACA